ncbi:TrmB family transcriptional regulator [Bordetella hinzii]|uniref:TrmB family transcriptional regulator n=1 Tax=Bordetella hinzii TaxID=103855 RepID=UPI0004029771|nr:helix-turn-helix domain-containing protein [Bordetella hinzii]AKQ57167.1 Sugar-specific transcriptional regulator TrmB [Bordetella hinzii]KCB24710.1 sugar-specific transcriptional regulator, TrmB family [Bordetella hinzii L60]KCB33595.1 sugar-specific transcriptional regulator, TrmB family [Bordetella hinzii CA90 BAL1384]KCB46403.1 sugar-specific transcriptional regulator, TrmB family [Bordetella hinzii 4161]KCB50144.1 sugar-specific transcriptional regulator, TrmB family [Bordetella hinzii
MDLEEKLGRLGISGNLYRVYRAAIELGEVPVSELAASAGLPRTTTYDAVLRLEEEGLLKIEGADRKRHVVAHDPSVLLEYVAARRVMVTEMMPELRSLYNQAKGKPKTRFYEGPEGIRTVLWDSLNATQPLRATFSMSELREVPGLEEINRYRDARIAKGIGMRVIRSRSRDTDDIWPASQAELRELRWAPAETSVAMTTLIYGNCVAMISSKRENYGLIIESEEHAQHQRMLFDAFWASCLPAG